MLKTANKYCLAIVLFWLIASHQTTHAQDVVVINPDTLSTDSDSEMLTFDINQPEGFNFWDERFKGNWAGVFIAFNGFDRADYSMYDASSKDFMEPALWKSNCLSINLLQASLRLQRNRNFIGLVTGMGMDLQSYSLDHSVSLKKGVQKIEPVYLAYEDNQKSKFSSTYLTVPLLIEFQVPIGNFNRRFYFSTGVIGSLRLSTHTKVKYHLDNKRQKLKTPGDFYLNDTRLSGTIRMGYGWVNLFATYDLNPLFKEDKGPVLYPFSVGLALVKF